MMQISPKLLVLALAIQPSSQCPSNRRRLVEGLMEGPWAPDEAAKERILRFQDQDRDLTMVNTCSYLIKSDSFTSFEDDPGNFICVNSGGAVGLNGDLIATISGDLDKQTVKITDSSCYITDTGYKAGNQCFTQQSFSNKMVVFDTNDSNGNGKDISHVQLRVECECLCANGGCGGDPHIKRWSGDRYYFHGEGDLVLLNSPSFDDKGLDVHVRTTIKDWYSKIETTAVRIGDSILEVSVGNTGKFLVDGKEYTDDDLPMSISGYTFERVASLKGGKGTSYILDLNNEDYIAFRVMKYIMSLDISAGTAEDFVGSRGMMGSYPEGDMVARDGKTLIEADGEAVTKKGGVDDVSDAMGFEWQVRSEEDPQLFSTIRAPQWPEPCKMPTVTQATSRHLRATNKEAMSRAQEACKHKSEQDFDFCVMDVIALGDESAAISW